MSTQTFSPNSFQTFGDLLKYLRRREHLTQLELSIVVGYSEAQIGRLEKNQRRPDLTALQALFIPALHLDNDPDLAARLLELAESARQEDGPVPGVAPYKGLLFFDEADADLFFGREALTAHLADRVTALTMNASTRLLAVVGASGSGKSSLVRAGLAVALKSAGWDVRIFTPGANPLRALEMQLNWDQAMVKSDRFLIVADQFEEVFTLCRDESDRLAFIQKLTALAQHVSYKPTVIITLRADFYSHCAQYPALRKVVAAQQEYIGQMTMDELRRAIEEPARYGKWEFDPGLVDVLLQDIGADGADYPEPGALPLLSHALLATWEHRRGRTFTLDGYRASGGVRGAIAVTAESVFTDQLNREQQELAQAVFLRLTELGEGTEDTRRRATLNELVNRPGQASQLRTVLNSLAEARLITLNEDSAEVAHEALIREWQRLHEWLTQDREGLRLHRHLTDSAREWEALGHDAGALYRGARLAQAREWATVNAERLNESERAFLTVSVEQEQYEALEREAQRQRELETAQKLAETEKARAEEQALSVTRLRQRAIYLFAALSIAIIAAIFAGVFAHRNGTLATTNASLAATAQAQANLSATQQAEVEANFIHAEAQRLAGDANSLLSANGSSELIALLSLRSMKIQYSPQGDAALAGAARLNYPRQILTSNSEVTSLAYSSDGKYIFTGELNGTAHIWDAQTGEEFQEFRPSHIYNPLPITWVTLSPDERYLLTMSNSTSEVASVITLWDIKTGKKGQSLFTHNQSAPNVAVFSKDGRYVFAGLNNSTVEIFEIQSGKSVKKYFLPDPALSILYISPDGKSALTKTSLEDEAVYLWSLGETVTKLQEFTYGVVVSGAPQNVAIAPDGKSLLIGFLGGNVVLWDIPTGEIVRVFYGHEADVRSVSFSPDAKTVLTGGSDKTARMWNVQTGAELLRLNTTSIVNSVAFSPDGQTILAGCADGTTQFWDVNFRSEPPLFTGDNDTNNGVSLSAVDFSPDGKFLATGGTDGLKLWDAETGQFQRVFPGAGSIKYGVRFSPDGLYLMSGSWSSAAVNLWDIKTGIKTTEQFLLFGMSRRRFATNVLNDVVFSADGKFSATNIGHMMYIWDRQTGQRVNWDVSSGIITRLDFSPDSRYLLVSTMEQVKLFESPLWTLKNRLIGTALLNGAAFSPNGKYIATASVDKLAHLWDVVTGNEIRQFSGHTDILYSVAFSPDGKYLATSSADGTARLWDVQTGEELRRFTGHTAGVQNVAFSPDGKYLATVSDDGTVRLWDVDYHTTIKYLCSILLRDFTDAERIQYNITDPSPTCPT